MSRKAVVIVGAGFGGLAAARSLADTPVDVTLIDRSNHHLFQPLLYEVATAALNPSDIASATRSLFSSTGNVRVLMDEVVGVDRDQSIVLTQSSGVLSFDYLVLATGADYSFFGREEWAARALVLKTMDDALRIRERVLASFEKAEREEDARRRAKLLTFVVVGGGPTGVEMAGAIAELGRTTLAKDFRRLQAEEIRIVLIEAGQRLLQQFSSRQSDYAKSALTKLGVEIRLGAVVRDIDDRSLQIDGERIEASTIIWAAGTRARSAAAWVNAQTARNGAIVVDEECRVLGHRTIFAVGDGASFRTAGGKALPSLAPVAKQQGRYVAALIHAEVVGKSPPGPFRYRDWGMMAVIGRSHAIADFGTFKANGLSAWLLWSLVHLLLLIDFRSRASVYLSWSYAWFTRGRIARLLTSDPPPIKPTVKAETMS